MDLLISHAHCNFNMNFTVFLIYLSIILHLISKRFAFAFAFAYEHLKINLKFLNKFNLSISSHRMTKETGFKTTKKLDDLGNIEDVGEHIGYSKKVHSNEIYPLKF